MQDIHVQQRQQRNNNLVVILEIFNQAFEVAQRPKKTVQKQQRFPVALFNEFEFFMLFDLVTHFPPGGN